SADCPVHARLVPTGSDDGNRLSLPPSASARNGCPGRCTARRTRLCVRSLPSAPHVPVADADDLRCLPPRDLLRHGPQNHFLYFHRPLHRGLRVREHACHVLLPSPPEKRTDHVLSQPDISCANDTGVSRPCPLPVSAIRFARQVPCHRGGDSCVATTISPPSFSLSFRCFLRHSSTRS